MGTMKSIVILVCLGILVSQTDGFWFLKYHGKSEEDTRSIDGDPNSGGSDAKSGEKSIKGSNSGDSSDDVRGRNLETNSAQDSDTSGEKSGKASSREVPNDSSNSDSISADRLGKSEKGGKSDESGKSEKGEKSEKSGKSHEKGAKSHEKGKKSNKDTSSKWSEISSRISSLFGGRDDSRDDKSENKHEKFGSAGKGGKSKKGGHIKSSENIKLYSKVGGDVEACVDKFTQCGVYKERGMCKHKSVASTCPKTCGTCADGQEAEVRETIRARLRDGVDAAKTGIHSLFKGLGSGLNGLRDRLTSGREDDSEGQLIQETDLEGKKTLREKFNNGVNALKEKADSTWHGMIGGRFDGLHNRLLGDHEGHDHGNIGVHVHTDVDGRTNPVENTIDSHTRESIREALDNGVDVAKTGIHSLLEGIGSKFGGLRDRLTGGGNGNVEGELAQERGGKLRLDTDSDGRRTTQEKINNGVDVLKEKGDNIWHKTIGGKFDGLHDTLLGDHKDHDHENMDVDTESGARETIRERLENGAAAVKTGIHSLWKGIGSGFNGLRDRLRDGRKDSVEGQLTQETDLNQRIDTGMQPQVDTLRGRVQQGSVSQTGHIGEINKEGEVTVVDNGEIISPDLDMEGRIINSRIGQGQQEDSQMGEEPAAPVDVGMPLVDAGSVDVGMPVVDTGAVDLGMPVVDVGAVDVQMPTVDAGAVDVGMPVVDVGAVDVQMPTIDTGAVDVGMPVVDARAVDVGIPVVNAGAVDVEMPVVDVGAVDVQMSAVDTGAVDVGMPVDDAGAVDAGMPVVNAGAVDVGMPVVDAGAADVQMPTVDAGKVLVQQAQIEPIEPSMSGKITQEENRPEAVAENTGAMNLEIPLMETQVNNEQVREQVASVVDNNVINQPVVMHSVVGKITQEEIQPGVVTESEPKETAGGQVDIPISGAVNVGIPAVEAGQVSVIQAQVPQVDAGMIQQPVVMPALIGTEDQPRVAPEEHIVEEKPKAAALETETSVFVADDDESYFLEEEVVLPKAKPQALGMESGVIPDGYITASSFSVGHEPTNARPSCTDAWIPAVNHYQESYIEIDVGKVLAVHGIGTKGHPTKKLRTTTYTVATSKDGIAFTALLEKTNNVERGSTFLKSQKSVFEGNTDGTSWTHHCLHRYYGQPVDARYIRFYPTEWTGAPALRVEAYGLRSYNDGLLLKALAKDVWTKNITGCMCYYDNTRFDCACCQPSSCQCPSENRHQCVQCGYGSACGLPNVKPRTVQVDSWTQAETGCACHWDQYRTDCACCQNYGCQCGQRNKNQCVSCGHPEECGTKEAIFGANEYCVPKICPSPTVK